METNVKTPPVPTTPTLAEALRLGAEALRGDAESAEGSGPLADPDGAARDRAAARILDALAPAAVVASAPDLPDLVRRIDETIDAVWDDDQWDRLASNGDDEYLAACDLIALVRVLQRLVVEGQASASVIAEIRDALAPE